MKKRKKGSALLWAVCSLLVLTLIVAGILALDQRYAQKEFQTYAKNQAAYYARSGVALAAVQLQAEGAECRFLPEFGDSAYVEFSMDATNCGVTIERTTQSAVVSLSAKAAVAGITETVYGRMLLQNGQWTFMGYSAS